MKFVFAILISIFTLFLTSNVTKACFKNNKFTLNDCIDNTDLIRDIFKQENDDFICIKDIKECLDKDLKYKLHRQQNILRNLGSEFKTWIDINISILNKRYDQAKKCIDSIDCGSKEEIIQSIECCSGANSHFGLPSNKWEDDSYKIYFEKCISDLSNFEKN